MGKNDDTDNLMKKAENLLEQLFDRIPEDQQMTEEDLSFEEFLDKILGEEDVEES